ncbi:hypothetical protein ARMGADRAFT_1168736 [Armillaria gallica]|uniref:Uncharacterized protein n=1 Tax=Armillaria gallica TaxID=47427 RepID=A0A2H3CVT4_ARMGA|nr:hypothetical protein ARMGADRAFT_1168736 [Armillaria gallica]
MPKKGKEIKRHSHPEKQAAKTESQWLLCPLPQRSINHKSSRSQWSSVVLHATPVPPHLLSSYTPSTKSTIRIIGLCVGYMSSPNISCAQCSHPVLSSFKESFKLLHSALDETTLTVATLLGTNDHPSPHQCGILRTSRGRVENALHEIDIIMEHLEHERHRLLNVQESHRRVMSPVRHLPAEILSKIFALSTTSFYDVFDSRLMDGPWALSKVCSEWRAVAIGCCPEMWNNMNISCEVDPRDPEALLRLVFSLCRDRPLHIRIGDIDNAVIALLSIVTEESPCWRSFEVDYPNPQLMSALGAVRGKLDNLEFLSIRQSGVLGQGLITTFETAPSLKSVELNGQTGEMQISLPFSQLRSYIDDSYPRAQGVSTAEYFLNILKKSPRLLKFHAGYYSWFPGHLVTVHPVVAPPFVHESLEELSSYDPSLLRSVLLPELKAVKMEAPKGKYTNTAPLIALCELIVRSNCSLTSLTLRNISLGYRGTPFMRHGFGMYTTTFLSGLAEGLAAKGRVPEDSARYDIVPLLTDLTIEVADEASGSIVFYSFLNCDFVDMVASRYCSAALRRVRVVAKSNGENQGIDFWKFGSDKFKQMKELKSEGLKICVFNESGWRGEQVDCLATAAV